MQPYDDKRIIIGKEFSLNGHILLNPRKCPVCKETTLTIHNRRIYYMETPITEGLSSNPGYSNFWLCKNCGKAFRVMIEEKIKVE